MKMFLMWLQLLVVNWIFCSCSSSSSSSSSSSNNAEEGEPVNPYRLPTTIKPILYNLNITTELEEPFLYHGEVIIHLNISTSIIKDSILNISLNKGIEIDIGNLTILDIPEWSVSLPATENYYNNKTEVWTLSFLLVNGVPNNPPPFIIGSLQIKFESLLRTDMRGYYLSTYQKNGQSLYTASTQFESSDARQAFPCWDEPSFKAKFQLTLTGPAGLYMLSNMDIASRSSTRGSCYYNREGKISYDCETVVFNPSPPMSTYLVAFFVGEYNSINSQQYNMTGGILTTIYFPLIYNISDATWALQKAYAILPYYEQVFETPYPLPKMDHTAIFDFAPGAMENWGFITYRITDLMANQNDQSISSLKTVAVVIAHELAHQWFGDIVTMEWWNDLWLNEGFASFMENLGVNHTNPEFQIWDDFVMSVAGALDLDVSQYTHPIQQPVSNPAEIDQLFDSITYDKGSALLRMLYEFMGPSQFLLGIKDYLNKYKYGNAQSYQLWEELSKYSEFNITSMMNVWITQEGFPVVTANYTSEGIFLEQNRMYKDGPRNDGQLWQIPISIELSDGTSTEPFLMTEKKTTINESDERYFLVNPDFNNYYRVWYDEKSFENIKSNFLNLNAASQYNILNDRFALMMNGYVDVEEYLFFLKYVWDNITAIALQDKANIDYLVWSGLISNALSVDDLFCEYGYSNNYLTATSATSNDENILTGFRTFITRYLKQMYQLLNGYNTNPSDTYSIINLRPQIILTLIQLGDSTAIEDGTKLYKDFVVSNSYSLSQLNPNLITSVLSAALATYNIEYYQQITEIIYPSVDTTQQDYILAALGVLYANDQLITEAIDFVLSSEVRNNVKIRGLYSCRRCKGRFNVWTQLSNNNGEEWDRLASIFRSGFAMSDLTAVFENFASETMLTNVRNFYSSEGRTTSANARVVNQTIESVNSREMWLEKNREHVQSFLEDIGDYPSEDEGDGDDGDDGSSSWYKAGWFIAVVIIGGLLIVAIISFFVCRVYRKRHDGHGGRHEGYLEIHEQKNSWRN